LQSLDFRSLHAIVEVWSRDTLAIPNVAIIRAQSCTGEESRGERSSRQGRDRMSTAIDS
jgi:hypothetical protein